jgi:hypothetical protein
MAKLSQHNKRYSSEGATAVAADIALGKTAWVSGTEITGSAHTVPLSNYPHVDGSTRTLIEWQGPVGSDVDPYTITAADCLVADPSVQFTSWDGHLDTNGLIYGSSSGDQWGRVVLPAKTTSERVYEMWGKITDPFVADMGTKLWLNYADTNNYWEVQFYWHLSSYLRCFIGEQTAGVYNFRGTPNNLAANIAGPATWFLNVHDGGDWIKVFFGAHEQDSDTEISANTTTYYVSNRSSKTVTDTRFLDVSATVGSWRTAGFRISDVVW